jgi:hypothetical protein
VPRAELWTRNDVSWGLQQFAAGSIINLDSIDCQLELDAIYAAARDA